MSKAIIYAVIPDDQERRYVAIARDDDLDTAHIACERMSVGCPGVDGTVEGFTCRRWTRLTRREQTTADREIAEVAMEDGWHRVVQDMEDHLRIARDERDESNGKKRGDRRGGMKLDDEWEWIGGELLDAWNRHCEVNGVRKNDDDQLADFLDRWEKTKSVDLRKSPTRRTTGARLTKVERARRLMDAARKRRNKSRQKSSLS